MIEIHEIPIPEAVGSEGWPDFATADDIHFSNESAAYATPDFALTAEEDLPFWLDQENVPTRMFVARDEGAIVGVATYETEPGDSPETAWLMVDVVPDRRGRGIGRALADKLHGVAATDGIHKAITYVVSPESEGERISAPTGFGSVPADNREVRFLLAQGYRLEQIERASRLSLPVETDRALTAALVRSGTDFALHTWIDHTPERWREDMARLRQRMSTEEPNAGLDEPEVFWSVERLIADEERIAASPITTLTAAIEQRDSGHLIGFTTLQVPAEVDRAVTQKDTLVLPEKRGHRLGMLLKLANLAQLEATHPGLPSVTTFNAEENRPMLDVNEAIGFVPVGHLGAWRRDLPH